ncbi:MAG: GNAT family N-acetyltransferase [Muribaculaceae bacterium]|nr:GNAT family N-acetyltransferase [Muribaculaceae bacterium]
MITQLDNIPENVIRLSYYLHQIDNDFGIPLSHKTELNAYASKLITKGIVIVSVENNEINGLLAGYNNDTVNGCAVISILSTRSDCRGRGISRLLVDKMIEICHMSSMKKIIVDSINPIAVSLYQSCGFKIVGQDHIEGRVCTSLCFQFDKK